MQIKKIMRRYFEGKLLNIAEIEPDQINLHDQIKSRIINYQLCWSDVFGCMLIIGTIIHFVASDRLFLVGHVLPSFGVLF